MTPSADAVSEASSRTRLRRLAVPLAASAVVMGATAYTALADPYRTGFFPSCIYLAATGHWCPGCGGLRAVHELARGDVGAALALNPVVVLLILPAGVLLLGSWLRTVWRGGVAPRIPMSVAIGIPAVLIAFWILRNIPVLEPYLAP